MRTTATCRTQEAESCAQKVKQSALIPSAFGADSCEERKQFFFEKKNQKTFVHWASAFGWRVPQYPKVFCFFFSKKKVFLAGLNRSASRALGIIATAFGIDPSPLPSLRGPFAEAIQEQRPAPMTSTSTTARLTHKGDNPMSPCIREPGAVLAGQLQPAARIAEIGHDGGGAWIENLPKPGSEG